MASIEYSLFRVKFIKPHQPSLFQENTTPHDALIRALSERPSAPLRAGYEWHVGNLRFFPHNSSSGYFAIGKISSSTIGKFDERTGDFIEEELEESPYTHCVFDANWGIIGIAKKIELSKNAKGIANRLEQLLSRTGVVARNSLTVEVLPIPDPDGFLKALNDAYRVFRFSATFRGPNPFDADEHFQKPLSVYISAADGYKGSATISGDNLNRKILSEVTRSTASTGNEASARIQKKEGQKAITINLCGDPVKRRYDEDSHRPEIVISELLAQYKRVRSNEAGSD
ncbi:hypothetical protein [Caldimonas tepidiphila]|uniref:hypothetical protein n=1 Tax=Caldimonas tepidiphila TaxID=2315841 RepID=UPI00130035DF|nr:hypothetical protein [Caldimonas tepidiphila]